MGEYRLTQEQFANLFYCDAVKDEDEISLFDIANNPNLKPSSVLLYNRGIKDPDYAKIALSFGTVSVGLDTSNIKYILDKDLNPIRVENANIVVNPNGDNFDFEGGNGSNIVNQILNQVADPSGIGKTVHLDFGKGAKIDFGTVLKEEFDNIKILGATKAEQKEYLKSVAITNMLMKKLRVGFGVIWALYEKFGEKKIIFSSRIQPYKIYRCNRLS